MVRDLIVIARTSEWRSNGLTLPQEVETHVKGVLQKEGEQAGLIEMSDLEGLESASGTPDAPEVVKRLGGCDVWAREQTVREIIARGLRTRLTHKVDPDEMLRLDER